MLHFMNECITVASCRNQTSQCSTTARQSVKQIQFVKGSVFFFSQHAHANKLIKHTPVHMNFKLVLLLVKRSAVRCTELIM